MPTILIEPYLNSKAKELSSIFSLFNFVNKVSSISKPLVIIAALQEHENLLALIVKKRTRPLQNIFNECSTKGYFF